MQLLSAALALGCGATSTRPAQSPQDDAASPERAAASVDTTPADMEPEQTAPSVQSTSESTDKSTQSSTASVPPNADSQAPSEVVREAQQSGAPPMRDVLYKVTPYGLVIEADGVRFIPRAKAVKLKGGAMGIHLEVRAKAIDEKVHTLLNPTHGPLSLAATLFKKNGTQFKYYGDQRDGTELMTLVPGDEVTFARDWPSGEVKGPLFWGQKVRLQVGLWGLGKDGQASKPLKAFCLVEMVGGANPKAVISPPEM